MTIPSALSPPDATADWHQLSTDAVLAHGKYTPGGLSSVEASQRHEADGPNELEAGRGPGALQVLVAQFRSLIVWIVVAAGVISAVLGDRVDAIAILTIVILNAGSASIRSSTHRSRSTRPGR